MMKMHQINKVVFVTLAAVVALAVNVRADLADASDQLADIASQVVNAKFNLAKAANSGDVQKAAEAARRSQNADKAMADAREAFAALEKALAGGDADAAASSMDDLKAAGKRVAEAVKGAVADAGKGGKGPGARVVRKGPKKSRKGYLPNIYQKLGDTDALSDLYEKLFNDASDGGRGGDDSSVFGGGAGDADATQI